MDIDFKKGDSVVFIKKPDKERFQANIGDIVTVEENSYECTALFRTTINGKSMWFQKKLVEKTIIYKDIYNKDKGWNF
jgi:hypothetical protein